MIKTVLVAVLLLLVAVPAAGEYYQYRDAQGNLRFTDDPANLPEDQRPDLQTFESAQPIPQAQPEKADVSPVSGRKENLSASPSPWEEKVRQSGQALDTLRAELSRTAGSLRERQKALETQAPGKEASAREKVIYAEQVEALNLDIEAYNKQREVFNEKVNAFNAQIGRGESRASSFSE